MHVGQSWLAMPKQGPFEVSRPTGANAYRSLLRNKMQLAVLPESTN